MKTLELIEKLEADKKASVLKFKRSKANMALFRDNGKPGETENKTFLYISAFQGDTGSRPIAPGTVFWESPDIELFDSNNSQLILNQMAAGQNYTISVDVSNGGDMTCNICIVELFICPFSIGFSASNSTKIGMQSIIVNGHNKTRALFNFSPGANDTGHQCLFARAYSFPTNDLPLSTDLFLVIDDRHVGQQNVNIIKQSKEMEFRVVLPTKKREQSYLLRIKERNNLETLSRFPHLRKFTKAKKIAEFDKFIFSHAADTENKHAPEIMRGTSRNMWETTFTRELNKMSLKIPHIGLKGREINVLDIEVLEKRSRNSIGGFTVIVTP